jgi:hypothetical protein
MFDQNDQNQQTQDATVAVPAVDTGFTVATATPTIDAPAADPSAPIYNTTVLSDAPQAPAADPFASPVVTDTPIPAEPAIATEDQVPAVTTEAPAVADTPVLTTPAVVDNGLLSIKQSALQSLTPLLSHLEQTPEEKFRTTMMMIQASDDQSLLQAAYDAANTITDEKTKAQALLDVVNEINYFTQSKAAGPQPQ